jgi:hypothetical protein
VSATAKHDAWLGAEARRIVLETAIAWLERGFVPSVFPLDDWPAALWAHVTGDVGAVPAGPDERVAMLRSALVIQRKRCAALRRTGGRRLDDLSTRFRLTPLEEDLVLLSAATAADPALGWILTAVRGHHELSGPTIALAAELFGARAPGLEVHRAFVADGTLLRRGIVQVGASTPGVLHDRALVPFPEREFHLADWALGYLLGADSLPFDSRVARLERPQVGWGDLVLPLRTRAIVEEGRRALAQATSPLSVVQMVGRPETSRRTTAAAVAGRLVVVDADRLARWDEPATALRPVLSAAALHDAALYLDDADRLWADAPEPTRAWSRAVAALAGFEGLVFLGVRKAAPDPAAVLECSSHVWAFDLAGADERCTLWRAALGARCPSDETLRPAAERARVSAGAAQRIAQDLLREGDGQIAAEALESRAMDHMDRELASFGELVRTGMRWEDLVLTESIRASLDDVRRHARYRDDVLHQWGFARIHARGQGLSVLFGGPPGTGKTQCAELLAADLGRRLVRIDLAQVVDKYVGETEKRLAELFDRAEQSDSVLLFDEADSLFVQRTSVRSASDRYANQTVNFLLQRLERHPGVVLLTTNLTEELDPAIRRRITFVLRFEEPDAAQRARIWQSCLPAEAPQEARIDWDDLGDRYAINGGHIKNAVLRAALRAREAGTPVTGELLRDEARHELRSLGRLVLD